MRSLYSSIHEGPEGMEQALSSLENKRGGISIKSEMGLRAKRQVTQGLV